MKTNMNHIYQAPVADHRYAGSTPQGTASVASNPQYTCSMHPEIVRDAPGKCPKCGMTLVPV